jgi:hypothetical protein
MMEVDDMPQRIGNAGKVVQEQFESLFGLNDRAPSENISGFMDLASECLKNSGIYRPERSHEQLLTRALTTNDFPGILSDTANKLIQENFRKQPATYPLWLRPWTVFNFKKSEIARVAYPGDMPQVPELGEYKQLDVVEGSEFANLSTYGGMISFSRQLLVNDDAGAFQERAQAGGLVAQRTMSRRAYRTLLNPGALNDDVSFFDSSRGNFLQGSSSETLELDADSLGKAIAALREQQDDNGNKLYLQPKYLVVPPSLEVAAWSLCLGSSLLGQPNSGIPNIFKELHGIVPVVASELADTALGGNDRNWFLFSDPELIPSCFKMLSLVSGWPQPFIDQQLEFKRDELQMKIRIDFEVAGINPKGCVKVQPYSG